MHLPTTVTKEMLAQGLMNGIDELFSGLWLSGQRRSRAPKPIYDWLYVRWEAHRQGVPSNVQGDPFALAWKLALIRWEDFRKQMGKAGAQ